MCLKRTSRYAIPGRSYHAQESTTQIETKVGYILVLATIRSRQWLHRPRSPMQRPATRNGLNTRDGMGIILGPRHLYGLGGNQRAWAVPRMVEGLVSPREYSFSFKIQLPTSRSRTSPDITDPLLTVSVHLGHRHGSQERQRKSA